MQIINYTKDGTVTTYHTILSKQGMAGFECIGHVRLADVPMGQSAHPTGKGLPAVFLQCPTCLSVRTEYPLLGGTEAQRLHARHRFHSKKHPAKTLEEAIEGVLCDVEKCNGVPSVELISEGVVLAEDTLEKYPVMQALAEELLIIEKLET